MANPFEQFDKEEKINPFAQFDAPADKGPELMASHATYAPEDQPSVYEQDLATFGGAEGQAELLKEPVRLAREGVSGLTAGLTTAAHGLAAMPAAYLGTRAGGGTHEQGMAAIQQAEDERKRLLHRQEEVIAPEPSMLSKEASKVVTPAVEKLGEVTGHPELVQAGLEAVGLIAGVAAPGIGAKKFVPKVAGKGTRLGESAAGRTLRGAVDTAEPAMVKPAVPTPGFKEARAAKLQERAGVSDFSRENLTANEKLVLRQTTPEAAKFLDKKSPEAKIDRAARSAAPYSPSEVQTPAAAARKMQDTVDVVELAAEMRDKIGFNRKGKMEMGDVPRTKQEAITATEVMADELGEYISEVVDAADFSIDISPIKDNLLEIAGYEGSSMSMVATAKAWYNFLDERAVDGTMAAKGVLDQIKNLNNSVKSVYSGKNVTGDNLDVLNTLAHELRGTLYDQLETIPGGDKFRTARHQLGKTLDLQRRLMKKMQMELNASAKTKMSHLQLIGFEKILRAIQTGNPSLAASGAGSLAANKAMQIMNSTDRQVAKMFTQGRRLAGDKRYTRPVVIKPTPPAEGIAP